jgi:hypothetical protein
VLASACGGGFTDSEDLGEAVFGEDPAATFSGGGEAGPLTGTADPGQAVVEVEGEQIVYEAAGSLFYTCEVAADRITINYQTPEGHDFNLQASDQGDGWIGSISFNPAEGDAIVGYGAQIPTDGTLGLGDNAISFDGTASRIEDFDFETQRDVQASIVVNCEPPGGSPTVTIGATEYEVPLSGAQSVTCEVDQGAVEIMINRLALEDRQLQISVRTEGDNLLGIVVLTDGEDEYLATMPLDGAGLEIESGTVTYSGPFVHTSAADPSLEEELEGTAKATCF